VAKLTETPHGNAAQVSDLVVTAAGLPDPVYCRSMSTSFRRPELSRAALLLMAGGGAFLAAGLALGYLVADHSSSDGSASSQVSVGLVAAGTLVILAGAVLLGCAAAARRWRAAGHSPGDTARMRPRSSRAVRAGAGLMAIGICCLAAGILAGVLLAAVSVSVPVGSVVLGVLSLGGPLAVVSGAVLLAGVALVRLWRRIGAR
jgi:uncharacterized membrane protein YidH (DUF202 family)